MGIFGKKRHNQSLRNQGNDFPLANSQNEGQHLNRQHRGVFSDTSISSSDSIALNRSEALPSDGAIKTLVPESSSSQNLTSLKTPASDNRTVSKNAVPSQKTENKTIHLVQSSKSKASPASQNAPQSKSAATNHEPDRSPSEKIDTAKNNLKQAIATYNDARRALQTSMFTRRDDLQVTLNRTKNEAEQVQHNIHALQLNLAQKHDAELASPQKVIQDLKERADKIKAELKTKQVTLDELNRQHHVLEEQAKATVAERKRFKQEEDKIMDAFADIKEPEKMLVFADAHREQIAKTKAGEQKLDKTQEALKNQLESSMAQINQTNDEIAKIKSDQAKNDQAMATAQSNLDQIKAKITDAENTNKDKLKQATQHQNKLSELSTKLTDQLRKINQEINSWLTFAQPVHSLEETDDSPLVLDIDSFSTKDFDVLTPLAQMLCALPQKKVGIFTTYFNVDLVSTLDAWLKANDFDTSNTQIINCLYQLQNEGDSTGTPATLPTNIQNRHWNEDHTVESITLPDGQTNMLVTYQSNPERQTKLIAEISYRDGTNLKKESYFSKDGVLSANAYYDDESHVIRKEFYRRDGLMVVSASYQDEKLTNINIFNEAGLQTNTFDSLLSLNVWWLQKSFPSTGAMIGNFESKEYHQLVDNSEIKLVPFVDKSDVESDDFTHWLETHKQEAFITDNSMTQSILAKKLKTALYVNSLTKMSLPVQLSLPE